MEEGMIRIEAKFSKQFFPKYDELVDEGDFAIISWEVIDVEEGNPQVHSFFNTITTKGYMCEFSRLETYTIIAREAPSDYGMQYDLIYIGQPADMTDVGNQRAFLGRILTKKQMDSLFKTLDNPVKYIEKHDIEKLSTVKGIGEKVAKNIIYKYEDNKDFSKVYIELDGYGISNKMMQKLIGNYGSPTTVIMKVKEDPYQLASEVDGIGFKKADVIALENGLEWNSVKRIKGFVRYKLEDKGENGNSYVYANELMYMIEDDLGDIGNEHIGQAITEMVENNEVGLIEGQVGQHKKVYLTKYYKLEERIAKELLRILQSENNFSFGSWKTLVKDIEDNQGWIHTDEQIEGIQKVLENQVCVINGKGGTGKTSVVTAMLEALKGYTFAQTALSGRASAKLQEVTGSEGQTIHRLLSYNPTDGFSFNSENKLPYDIIILDEISLVGGQIFLKLIQAIKDGAKLVILGDDGQLESIGCMNLARDLIINNNIPSIELTQIHRQAAKSGIITEASKVRNNKQLCDKGFSGISIRGELEDFELNIIKNLDETRPTMVNYFKEWLPKVKDIMDIQMLVPINERGDCCVDKLNDDIQDIYNPEHRNKAEIEIITNKKKNKKFIIRETDKVMVMKNNYKTVDTNGKTTSVFNGWIGIVKEVMFDESVVVYFSVIEKNIVLPRSFLVSVRLGYACSVHKFQGSSAKVIIGGIDYSTPPFMRTKELVYTMITRAEKYCVLVSQNAALTEAIETSGVSEKNTFLKEIINNIKDTN